VHIGALHDLVDVEQVIGLAFGDRMADEEREA
jgi:hypothetical protein